MARLRQEVPTGRSEGCELPYGRESGFRGKVDNNHTYTYDANGNLVYVNTGRIKQDGTLDSTAAERKLRWDEENRLTTSDDTLNATDE